MIDGLSEADYLDWNYDFFRIHRVMPPVGKNSRGAYRLKDLQITSLQDNPAFGRALLASLLMRMYDALWIQIDNPKDLLVSPGAKTMSTLAAHCHRTAQFVHDKRLGE